MKNSIIDGILCAATLDRGIPAQRPIAGYERLAETEAAYNVLADDLADDGQRDALAELYNLAEAQGFRNGLRYGARLAVELGLGAAGEGAGA